MIGKINQNNFFLFYFRFWLQKQYSDLFALAAEDDTTGVGRRGTSGRGRKPPANKKESNSSNSHSKKNSEPINNIYSSDEVSSEVRTMFFFFLIVVNIISKLNFYYFHLYLG